MAWLLLRGQSVQQESESESKVYFLEMFFALLWDFYIVEIVSGGLYMKTVVRFARS